VTDSFPAKLAAYYGGLKTRMMLDYLERAEVFEREEVRTTKRQRRHHGLRRRYTFRDVIVIRAIAALLDKGVSVQRIKAAMLAFSRDDKFSCDRDKVRHGSDVTQYFVTDGNSIFYARENQLIDIVKGGQGAFSFVVDLDHASREARKVITVDKLPRKQVRKA
jgi:DNA-binding transcriptional MerR regulator